MIKLTYVNDAGEVWMNPGTVVTISKVSNGALIYYGDGPGNYINVVETPEEIIALMEQAARARETALERARFYAIK